MNRTGVRSGLSPAVLLTLLFVVLGISPPDAAAQGRQDRSFLGTMRTGIGYNAALPDASVGIGGWHLFGSKRFGLFADAKMTPTRLTKDDDYCPGELGECTVGFVERERGDLHIRDEKEWLIFNAGGMYAVSPDFAIMVGGGVARRARVREYLVEDELLWITPTGTYFVSRDDDGPTWKPQAIIGGLLRAGSSLAFSFGFETAARGLSVGAYLVLP